MVSIVYATEKDSEYWISLDKHLPKSEFDAKIRDKRCYLICDGGAPCGVLRYNLFWDQIPFLTLIYLEESARAKGIGQKAMGLWEGEMQSLGHAMVMASTQADEDAQHFYRRLGYMEKGCLIMDIKPFEQPMEMLFVKSV